MASYSNQKSVIQIKINFMFEILQIATLCLDSFAHSWHTLNQLEVVTWSAFQLTGVPS